MKLQIRYAIFTITYPLYILFWSAIIALTLFIAIPVFAIFMILRTPSYDEFLELLEKRNQLS